MAAPKLFDRVKETTATTGAGTYALSGIAATGGFLALSSVLANGDSTLYCVVGMSAGVPAFEVSRGVYATPSPGTLTRATVLKSSNADAAVSWDAGDKVLFIVNPAAYSELSRMKHKFDAAVAPTSGEDQADGYFAGSFWLDATGAKLYVDIDDAGTWLNVLASRFAAIHSATSGTAAVLSGGAMLAVGIGAAATEDDAIAIGELAVADGVNSSVLGGYDNEATSTAENAAVLGGTLASVTAKNSTAIGGVATETVWFGESATGGLSSGGTVVGSRVVMAKLTTEVTPTALLFDNNASNGYLTVREGEMLAVHGFVTARSTADMSMWEITGAIYRNAAGNVIIDDAFTVTLVSQTAGAAAWATAVTADTTNQQPKFDVTGAAATNITWGGMFSILRSE